MRTSNGFDRLSTEEELHQVLAVLQGVSRNGWIVYEGEDSAESQDTSLSADTVLTEDDAECLNQLVAKRPELKN